jgi:hypothetical protein
MACRITQFCVIAALITALLPMYASADEYTGTPAPTVSWVGAGALFVNSGVAFANGWSLAAGTSNRRNGMFGVVLGSTTMAVSAVALMVADTDQTHDFSIMLGLSGLASTATGLMSIRFSSPAGQDLTVAPLVNPFGSEDSAKAGLQLKFDF